MTEQAFDAAKFLEQLALFNGHADDRAAIDNRKNALRADAAARDELAAETAPAVPAVIPGGVFLSQPDDKPAWRISNLWPAGGNVVLAAQFKSGKTTLRDNLIGTWCDGGLFLGRYAIIPADEPIFVIDAEMPTATARRWLNAHLISHADRFTYVNIRGAAASLNPLVPSVRTQWARHMVGHGAVLLDCAGPVMGALGLDENKSSDVGRFLAGWEQLLAEAAVPESFVIHHMGHLAERSRGASRLRDWPDAEWRLVRQDDDPASPRYLLAFGRDVEVPESRLDFDPETRRLTVGGGSRRDLAVTKARQAIGELLADEPRLSAHAIELKLGGDHGRNNVRAALKTAVQDKEVTVETGPRNARLHSLSSSVRHTSPLD